MYNHAWNPLLCTFWGPLFQSEGKTKSKEMLPKTIFGLYKNDLAYSPFNTMQVAEVSNYQLRGVFLSSPFFQHQFRGEEGEGQSIIV